MPIEFNRLPRRKKEEILRRYHTPEDMSKVMVNRHGIPYIQESTGRMAINLKKDYFIDGGFHTHEEK